MLYQFEMPQNGLIMLPLPWRPFAVKKAAARSRRVSSKPNQQKRWSGRVTRESHALDLENGVFTLSDPKRIARSLKRSADSGRHRKADPFRSAMSMLTFFINRAGKSLGKGRRKTLEAAKAELRKAFGRPA